MVREVVREVVVEVVVVVAARHLREAVAEYVDVQTDVRHRDRDAARPNVDREHAARRAGADVLAEAKDAAARRHEVARVPLGRGGEGG